MKIMNRRNCHTAELIVYHLSFIVFYLVMGVIAHGQVDIPAAINYQARLTNPSDGKPVESGVYQIEFRVWGHPTSDDAGYAIWGRSFPVHVVTNGLFNILLSNDGGPLTNPTPQTNDIRQAFQGADRYLGLRVIQGPDGSHNEPEIKPRQRLVSAPYAMHAQNCTDAYQAELADVADNAEKLGGQAASNYYDQARFEALGLSSAYMTLPGWETGGMLYKSSIFDYGGKVCMGGPSEPAAGVKLLVRDGKIKAEDGIEMGAAFTPTTGGAGNGIEWAEGSDGGGGDQAWMRYSGTSGDGVLEVGVGNDSNDKIKISSSGDIEMQGKLKALGQSDVYYSPYHNFTARADGFVCINIGKMHGHSWVKIYINGHENVLFYAGSDEHGSPNGMSFFVPVAKGDVWQVQLDNVDSYQIQARYFGIPFDS